MQPTGMRKGSQYSEAVRLVVAVRHVLGFEVHRTQRFLATWGNGPAWIKKCVEELNQKHSTLASLHQRNRRRQSEFRIVGLLDRQYDLPASGVLDIETGHLLISVRADAVGRATLGWIAMYVSRYLADTGAALRLLARKPLLSPHREITLKGMESQADALRLVLDQLSEGALYQPGQSDQA